MTTMSVAAALNQKKILADRVAKARATTFVNVRQHGRVPGFATPKGFEDQARANFASIKALLSNLSELKAKIVESNAHTFVTVNGEKMTVAAAIELKTSIQMHKDLLTTMTAQWTNANALVSRQNDKLQSDTETQVAKVLTGVDKASEQYLSMVNAAVAQNKVELLDPIKIEREIEQLDAYIQGFEAEIDLALTTSNVVTMIEVSF